MKVKETKTIILYGSNVHKSLDLLGSLEICYECIYFKQCIYYCCCCCCFCCCCRRRPPPPPPPLYESQLTERDRPYNQRLDSDPCQNQNIFLLTRKCHTSCPLQLLSLVLRQETNFFLLLLVLLLLYPLSVFQSVCVFSMFIFQHLSRH